MRWDWGTRPISSASLSRHFSMSLSRSGSSNTGKCPSLEVAQQLLEPEREGDVGAVQLSAILVNSLLQQRRGFEELFVGLAPQCVVESRVRIDVVVGVRVESQLPVQPEGIPEGLAGNSERIDCQRLCVGRFVDDLPGVDPPVVAGGLQKTAAGRTDSTS